MSENEKAWIEFIEGNPELVSGFGDVLAMAFDAGWLAGRKVKAVGLNEKRSKKEAKKDE